MTGASARNQSQTISHRALVPLVPGSWSKGGSQQQVELRQDPCTCRPAATGTPAYSSCLRAALGARARWQEGGVNTVQRVHASTGGEMRVETKTRAHVCLLDATKLDQAVGGRLVEQIRMWGKQ